MDYSDKWASAHQTAAHLVLTPQTLHQWKHIQNEKRFLNFQAAFDNS